MNFWSRGLEFGNCIHYLLILTLAFSITILFTKKGLIKNTFLTRLFQRARDASCAEGTCGQVLLVGILLFHMDSCAVHCPIAHSHPSLP